MGLEDSFHKGLKAYRDGQYQEAIQLLYEAVSDNEKNHKAWNALGVTFSKLGRFEEAVNCYENALKYDPGNTSYEQNRDQIVKKAFSKIQSEPTPQIPVQPVDLHKLVMPGAILGIIVVLAIVILSLSSLMNNNPADSVPSIAEVSTSTDDVQASHSPALDDTLKANVSSQITDIPPSDQPRADPNQKQPALIIDGDLMGKYFNSLSELTFTIALTEGSTPQYLPRVSYLWSVGSLDPITVLPANPASGTIKPGDSQLVTLQIPLEQQPQSGEKYTLEIRPPSGMPSIYSATIPEEYRGGVLANPSPDYGPASHRQGEQDEDNGRSSTISPLQPALSVEGSLNGYYGLELEQLTLTLRALATGSPQDLNRLSYIWTSGASDPVQITRMQPASGTINPGEQQLITLTIPEGHRPRGGDMFTLEIRSAGGEPLVIQKTLSSAYRGGIIP